MNILITAPSLNPSQNVSGIATVAQTIIQYNQHHRYYHYLLGRPDKATNKLIWLMHSIKQLVFFPFILKKINIDLVHQNLPLDPKGVTREYIINLWCRLMGIPVVLHVHGGAFLMKCTNNQFFKKLSKSLFKHSKQVVVLSEIEKDAIKEHYQYQEATVLCNAIDTNTYKPSAKQLHVGKPTFLFLGRIHESKGVDDIIDAFRLLKGKMDFRFILCGAGPLKDHFVTACVKLLSDDFEYRGVVSGKAKIEIIKESNFFLLPSRYGEGLPMALLETMAAGVVPVVTDDASMKYVVQHQINGIRVAKRNPFDIYEKLSRVLSDKMLFESLSAHASKTIEEQYNIENYVVQLNEIYNLALMKTPRAKARGFSLVA